jgi:hypothetical protein
VIAADTGVETPPMGRGDRRDGEHHGAVGLPPVHRTGVDASMGPPVGDGQPGAGPLVDARQGSFRRTGQVGRQLVQHRLLLDAHAECGEGQGQFRVPGDSAGVPMSGVPVPGAAAR